MTVLRFDRSSFFCFWNFICIEELKLKIISYQGDKTATLSFVRDITERKQAEEALQESEERLRVFMNSATESLYLLDSELNIVEVNKNSNGTVELAICCTKGSKL